MKHCSCFCPTCRISTGTAVQFIFLRIFSHRVQNLLHLLFIRNRILNPAIPKLFVEFNPASINTLCFLPVAHLILHIHLRTDQRLLPFIRCRSLNTSSLAHIYLEETVLNLPFFQLLKKFHTGLQTVNMYFIIIIFNRACLYRRNNSSTDGIQLIYPGIRIAHRFIFTLPHIDSRFLPPFHNLLEGQNRINRTAHSLVTYSFFLLCNTRSKKDNLHIIPIDAPDQSPMGNHRGNYRRHIWHKGRIIFLNQVIYTRAAGSDDIRHLPFLQKLPVFCSDQSRTFRRLPHLIKAQFFECSYNLTRFIIIQYSQIGRSN